MHATAPRRCGSDVNGLLLGRQQSVHGCWHRLHVDLRAESHVSRGWEWGLRNSASHYRQLSRLPTSGPGTWSWKPEGFLESCGGSKW